MATPDAASTGETKLDTTSTAAQKLGIPAPTLIGLERRGVVGPFQRDAAGRRLISSEDLAAVRAYLASRGRLPAERTAA